MSGLCDTCQRLKRIGCGLVMDSLKTCDLYEGESRYDKLFGTPERAARTFADFCNACDKGECNDCPLDRLTNFCIGYKDLLEWLKGDAE